MDRERRPSGDGVVPHDYRAGRGPLPGARSRQPKYSEESYNRRAQLQEDEEYARRLQYEELDDDDYLSDYDETTGLENSPDHYTKDGYRRGSQSLAQPPPAPTPPPAPVPPVPPMAPTFDRTPPVTDYVSGVNRARGVRATSIDRLADRFSDQRRTGSPVHRFHSNSMTPGAGSTLAIGGPPPPPAAPSALLMRHHTMDDEMFSTPRGIRMPSDRMIMPRRATQNEYLLDEPDLHPLSPPSSIGRRRGRQRGLLLQQQSQREEPPPSDSVLAGLTGPGQGRATNRVFEWSKHVEPGLPDNPPIAT